jgi:hypothetical protein
MMPKMTRLRRVSDDTTGFSVVVLQLLPKLRTNRTPLVPGLTPAGEAWPD